MDEPLSPQPLNPRSLLVPAASGVIRRDLCRSAPPLPPILDDAALRDSHTPTAVAGSITPVAGRNIARGDRFTTPVFVSSERWQERRIGAVAIYCSDGRWGDAIDEFCHRGLGIPAYDRFAVPGGPAWIVDGAPGRKALVNAAQGQLEFLVHAHKLQRVVLITHWGCAFYGHSLGCGPEQCLETQLQDVAKAANNIREWFGPIEVEEYLAARDGDVLSFERI